MNGLDPNGLLLTGTVLKLPGGAPAPAQASPPEPATQVVPEAAPEPTAQQVAAVDVQNVAAAHGVSPSLATAIAWQESGFNNSMVSPANARGVMQVMPGTWDYVQENLAGGQALDPNSATDNIHAGVMYLKRLLTDAGGDENSAIAGYYQGLASVRERGMYDDTQAVRGQRAGAEIPLRRVMDPSPGQLADEIDYRIRELPDRRTDAVRGVRREYTRRLRSSPPDAVLEVIDALVPRHRWVAYELLYHHPQAFGLLDRERVERLGRGLDGWGAVDAFGRYLSGTGVAAKPHRRPRRTSRRGPHVPGHARRRASGKSHTGGAHEARNGRKLRLRS